MRLVVKICHSDDGRFRAWCPSLPGVSVAGDTRREVVSKIDREIYSLLAGFDIPQPAAVHAVYEWAPQSVFGPVAAAANHPAEFRRPRPGRWRVFPAGYFTE